MSLHQDFPGHKTVAALRDDLYRLYSPRIGSQYTNSELENFRKLAQTGNAVVDMSDFGRALCQPLFQQLYSPPQSAAGRADDGSKEDVKAQQDNVTPEICLLESSVPDTSNSSQWSVCPTSDSVSECGTILPDDGSEIVIGLGSEEEGYDPERWGVTSDDAAFRSMRDRLKIWTATRREGKEVVSLSVMNGQAVSPGDELNDSDIAPEDLKALKTEVEMAAREKESKTRLALINKQKAASAKEPVLTSSANERRAAARKPKNRNRRPLAGDKEVLHKKDDSQAETESMADSVHIRHQPVYLIDKDNTHTRLGALAKLLEGKDKEIDGSNDHQMQEAMDMVTLLDNLKNKTSARGRDRRKKTRERILEEIVDEDDMDQNGTAGSAQDGSSEEA